MNEDSLSRRQAFMVLNGLPLMGPITLNRLLSAFDSDPVAVLSASERDLQRVKDVGPAVAGAIANWRDHFPLEREERGLEKIGAGFLISEDEAYPPMLREIYDPPIGLYRLGKYKIDRPCVAIVGSRGASLYGKTTAFNLARDLGRRGFCIVSGMARGIDRAAHEGALEAGAPTLAVFGNGLDVVYPPENIDLYRSIPEKGLILSEFPFGKKANRTTFPMRNRVVSGICEALVVVETAERGGSVITARFAAEQGRQVFAVPGRIDSATSVGCHQLLRDGATLLTCADELIDELGYRGALQQLGLFGQGSSETSSGKGSTEKSPGPAGEPPDLDASERELLGCFRAGEILGPDQLAEMLSRPVYEIASGLMLLELKGVVLKRADGRFEARFMDQ